MPSQFPYLPKYIYILISQIHSKYGACILKSIACILCITAKSPTLTYLVPLAFSTYLVPLLSLLFPHLIHQRLFAIPTKSLLCSISETLFLSVRNFVLLGYGCGFMFGLGQGYLVLSSEKPKWLVNVVYIERHNMV